jgi:hypothetical protein
MDPVAPRGHCLTQIKAARPPEPDTGDVNPGGSIMKLIGKTLGLGVLVSALAGCASYTKQADLNNDARPDTVSGHHTEGHFFYSDYQLYQELSRPDGTYEKRRLVKFNGKPDDIWFEDVDKDGDLDLRCTQTSKTRWDYIVDGEYVALNDGRGNFGELEPVDAAGASLASSR